jgi:carboxypeptidase Taq
MQPRAAYTELLRRVAEIHDLSSASALLSWDQETTMPKLGAPARARQLATIAGIRHERFVDPRVGELLCDCESSPGQFEEVEGAQMRELRYDWDRQTRLPRALVEETASAESSAIEAWRDARAKSDWKAFTPHVRALMGYSIARAKALGFTERPYDGLLDDYERGADEERLDHLFSHLRPRLAPLVGPVLERRGRVDSACVRRPLAVEKQAEFGLAVIRAMGFDLDAGRVDLATHPFCSGIGPGDTRLTRRFDANDLRPALYGIVHEAGHGLYEQGLATELRWTPLGSASSLGVHESQSRLWENIVGRSRAFWQRFLPDLRRLFPAEFRDVSVDAIYRAVNEVATTLIRVEADELTYNLHVLLRFEVERALFSGDLDVADVPAAWSAQSQELLGIRPSNDAEGCLQDIHWSMGAFGYFPTYTLGNLYAAQLFEAAQRDLGDLDGAIARGEFTPLRQRLRDKVHKHGRRYLPSQLVFRATGEEPSAEPFLRYLRTKLGDVYGI